MLLKQEGEDTKTRTDLIFKNGNAAELLYLKIADIRHPGNFDVTYDGRWTYEILENLQVLLVIFAARRIVWERIYIHSYHEANDEFIVPFLSTANALSLCKGFEFYSPHQDAKCFPDAEMNRNLEAIDIRSNGPGDFRDFQSLRSLLQGSITLKTLNLENVKNFDHELLSDGLTNNKTLEKVHLSFWNGSSSSCDVTDEGLAAVITPLASNPSFQELVLDTSGQFGPLTSQAIYILLRSSISLTKFIWCDFYAEVQFREMPNMGKVFLGMKESRTLKHIGLHPYDRNNDDSLFSKLFDTVRHCQALEKVDCYVELCEEEVARVWTLTRLSKPMIFGLRSKLQAIKSLVEYHPEIRFVRSDWWHSNSEHSKDFCFASDFNWHGRYLLDRSDFPLSLWPLVLKKASLEKSVIYEFIKGPAFASRQNFC